MKRLWIAVGILTVSAALCIAALLWQLSTIDRLRGQLAEAESAVLTKSADAMEKTVAFRDACVHTSEQFAFLARHIDSCPLQESASLLPAFLAAGDDANYHAEVNRCLFYLEELRRSEKPIFGNIF